MDEKKQLDVLTHFLFAVCVVWIIPDYIQIPIITWISYNTPIIRKKVVELRSKIIGSMNVNQEQSTWERWTPFHFSR